MMRALIVSRFELLGAALGEILRHDLGIGTVDLASDLSQTRTLSRAQSPRLIVVGAECMLPQPRVAVATLRRAAPDAALVAMTSAFQRPLILPLIMAGCDTVLHYESARAELARAIRAAIDGGMIMGKTATALMLRATRERARGVSLPPRRELAILNLVASGRSNKAIATRLGLTEGTVKAYVRRLRQRLGARDRTHAAMVGVALGLVDLSAASHGADAASRLLASPTEDEVDATSPVSVSTSSTRPGSDSCAEQGFELH